MKDPDLEELTPGKEGATALRAEVPPPPPPKRAKTIIRMFTAEVS
jgi:hypothetical protein